MQGVPVGSKLTPHGTCLPCIGRAEFFLPLAPEPQGACGIFVPPNHSLKSNKGDLNMLRKLRNFHTRLLACG